MSWSGGRQFTLCITDTSVCQGISWPTDLSDFSSLQIQPSCCLISHGSLGQSAFSLQIDSLLLRAACQFIHPYRGNLTINWSAYTLDLNSTLQISASLQGKQEEGDRERRGDKEREKGEIKRERERERVYICE